MSDFTYKQTEEELWTTGYYHLNGRWEPESDHSSAVEAAAEVHFLNGGTPDEADQLADALRAAAESRRGTRR